MYLFPGGGGGRGATSIKTSTLRFKSAPVAQSVSYFIYVFLYTLYTHIFLACTMYRYLQLVPVTGTVSLQIAFGSGHQYRFVL